VRYVLGQHPENVRDPNTHSANAGPFAAFAGFDRNAFEKFHPSKMPGNRLRGKRDASCGKEKESLPDVGPHFYPVVIGEVAPGKAKADSVRRFANLRRRCSKNR